LKEGIISDRAKRGNRDEFPAVLSNAPDVLPLAGDEFPAL
jgi:hypothetical protein